MADIFISYSSEDIEKVKPLAKAFELEGWSVWWDRRLSVGQNFQDIIENAIDEARCIVVIWSSNSIKSKWVKAEASEGDRKEILAPIKIEDVQPPLLFRQIHTISLEGWNGSTNHPGYSKLIQDLTTNLSVKEQNSESEKLNQNNELTLDSEKVNQFLEENNLYAALDVLNKFFIRKDELELCDDTTILHARYKRLERKKNQGIINDEVENVEMNKLIYSIMQLNRELILIEQEKDNHPN